MKTKSILAAVLLATGVISHDSNAAVTIDTPAGLNPGDKFYLVFVTDGTHDASSSDLGIYDAFVTADANDVGGLFYHGELITWQALISTENVSAQSRFNPAANAGIYRLDGVKIANDGSDFWDESLQNPIDRSPSSMSTPVSSYVFTGITSGGSLDGLQIGSPDLFAWSGESNLVTSSAFTSAVQYTADIFPFYAFSDELTVPIPEPAVTTLVIGGCAVAFIALRKRANKMR